MTASLVICTVIFIAQFFGDRDVLDGFKRRFVREMNEDNTCIEMLLISAKEKYR